MNQDELIERRKEVAEYDGWELHNVHPTNNPLLDFYLYKAANDVLLFEDLKYHTSFDWSVPVWSKIYTKDVYTENGLALNIDILVEYNVRSFTAINNNNPLQFFINLSDLIREIKKYK